MYSLAEIRKMCAPVFARYGVGRVVLFGSYARGEAEADSDLDFYIEQSGDIRSLLGIAGLYVDFEEIFSCSVDILSGEIEDTSLYANICRDGVVIYENRKKCTDIKEDGQLL